MTREKITNILQPRKTDTHKGDYGHILVIAGSPGMTGAAYLTSQAALFSGAGLVTLAIPASSNTIMATKLTEVMTLPVAENREGTFAAKSFDRIFKFVSEKVNVLAIGPGIRINSDTELLIKKILKNIDKPIVLDADAINIVSKNISILKNIKSTNVIFTPHIGEMARLVKIPVTELKKDQKNIARNFAKEHKITIVLKSCNTIVASSNGKIYYNLTGNPGMATAGTGDVLTGIIASFIGQKIEQYDACRLGVYVHSLAADYGKKISGEVGLTAGQILAKIPEAINSFYKKNL